MTEKSEAFKLVKAQMDKAKEDMMRYLDEQFFKTEPFMSQIKVTPIPNWKKYCYRAKYYFHTLWLAIKGTELVEPEDY